MGHHHVLETKPFCAQFSVVSLQSFCKLELLQQSKCSPCWGLVQTRKNDYLIVFIDIIPRLTIEEVGTTSNHSSTPSGSPGRVFQVLFPWARSPRIIVYDYSNVIFFIFSSL